MAKKKILFISQEIMPYLPESEMAHIGRYLPQGIQAEVRFDLILVIGPDLKIEHVKEAIQVFE